MLILRPLSVLSLVLLSFGLCSLQSVTAASPGLSPERPESGRYVETDHGFMVPYKQQIPGTDVYIEMTPVPGGVVTLGLREPDEDAAPEELSPKVRVKLDPYWVGVREITWSQYWPYMELDTTFSGIGYLRGQLYEGNTELQKQLSQKTALKNAIDAKRNHVDGVTAPTPLYDPSTTYFSGEDPNLPAVTMTVYAARQYTKWLSVITGIDHRLPSEAEWEHAARAGADGDLICQSEELEEYAWFDDNSEGDTHLAGQKKPNRWGLYDVVGNAAEWVLDSPTSTPPTSDEPLSWRAAITLPEQQYPRTAKGGFWEATAEECRFAWRLLSHDEDWKASDPSIPLSPWWFTDDPASGVGIRIVRPLNAMDASTKKLAWEIDSPDLKADVDARMFEGRGKLQTIDKDLPKVVEQLDSDEIRKLME